SIHCLSPVDNRRFRTVIGCLLPRGALPLQGPPERRSRILSPFATPSDTLGRADKRPTRLELSSGHKPLCPLLPVSCRLIRIKVETNPTACNLGQDNRKRFPASGTRTPQAGSGILQCGDARVAAQPTQATVTVAGSSLRPGPIVEVIATFLM